MDADRNHMALGALLMQSADDDLVVAARASEWLGLGLQLEEDVAFSSIAQNEMGHAATSYGLPAAGGGGRQDSPGGALSRSAPCDISGARGPDGVRRMQVALGRAADLASSGPMAAEIEALNLLPDASHLADDWRARVV